MTTDEKVAHRREVLEEVFDALTRCRVHALATPGLGLGMRREDASQALAGLNGGIIPRRDYDRPTPTCTRCARLGRPAKGNICPICGT